MENEMQAEGVSVSDVLHILGRKIWYILGAAVLFAAAVVSILAFVIDPLVETYSMDFRLVFPMGGGGIVSYPDGSPFFYQDMISSSFLSEARSSDGKFSRVDVDRMLKNGDISISAETVTENNVVKYTGRYTVTVHGSYFGSGELAGQFIEAIAQVPVGRMRGAAEAVNYASDKKVFESAPFEERIELLGEEKANLLAVYDAWIDAYSETYSVRIDGENGASIKRLKDFRDAVAVLFGESVREELESELEFGGYYYGDLAAYTAQLKLQYAQNEAEIERLRALLAENAGIALASAEEESEVWPVSISSSFAELVRINNRIDHWVNASGTVASPTLTEENVARFSARLTEEFDKLNAEAARLTDVIAAIYKQGMSAHFDAQKVTASGDVGLVVGGIASFLIGLAVGGIVAYAVEMNKRKRAAAPAEAAQ